MSEIDLKLPKTDENVSLENHVLNLQLYSSNWFDLPFELREMVIDRMDARTRCRFAQCSKICEKEAKGSKFYLTAISIERSTTSRLLIGHEEKGYKYSLEFMDVPNLTFPQSVVTYITRFSSSQNMDRRVMKWAKAENGEANDVRKRYITEMIEKYGKSITIFGIADPKCSMIDINLKNLRNLKQFFDYRLNKRYIEDLVTIGTFNSKQIYRMNSVYLPDTKVKFDDILKFEGKSLSIQSDDFGIENIRKYLQMWKNGEIHKNLGYLTVKSNKFKSIEREEITEGLDVFDYEDDGKQCRFRFYRKNDTNEKWVTNVYLHEKKLHLTLQKN